jgi:hypothetical protein
MSKTLDEIHTMYNVSSEKFTKRGLNETSTNPEAMAHIAELKSVIVDLINLYSVENSKFAFLQMQHMKCGK